MNILEVDDSFGKFDYIICHGAYSWVPVAMKFVEERSGGVLTLQNPLSKAAMFLIARARPEYVSYDRLFADARKLAGISGVISRSQFDLESTEFGRGILGLFVNRAIELHSYQPPIVVVPGDRPRASSLARIQSQSGQRVTSLMHESVLLTQFESRLLPFLDGSKTLDEIVSESAKLLENEFVGDNVVGNQLEQSIRDSIARFGQLGLLVRT